jgi:hypothetical protein
MAKLVGYNGRISFNGRPPVPILSWTVRGWYGERPKTWRDRLAYCPCGPCKKRRKGRRR